MPRAASIREGRAVARRRSTGLLLLVVLLTLLAWSLRVAFVDFDALSDLSLAGYSTRRSGP